MNIEFFDENENIPMKIVLYGEPGIGKSTVAAQMEAPLFLDLENGAARIKDSQGKLVKRVKNLNSYEAVKQVVIELANSNMNVNGVEFKTLVLDSIDWLEGLVHKKIIGTSNKDIIRVNGGYGAGLRESERIHKEFIHDLEIFQTITGCDVVSLAHEKVKEVKDPEAADDYEKFKLKLEERVSSLWQEWSEALLFARYEVLVDLAEDSNKSKSRAVSNEKRILITQKRPGSDAKNRYGLSPVLSFTPDVLVKIKQSINTQKKVQEKTQEETKEEKRENITEGLISEALMLADEIKDPTTKKLILETIENNKNSTIKKIKNMISRIKGVLES